MSAALAVVIVFGMFFMTILAIVAMIIRANQGVEKIEK